MTEKASAGIKSQQLKIPSFQFRSTSFIFLTNKLNNERKKPYYKVRIV
jgi:hypothetical protein